EKAIEEELEGGVRLTAEGDLGAVEEDFAFAEVGLRYGDAVVEVGLAPGPTAVEDVAAAIPGDGLDTAQIGIGCGVEGGAVIEEDIDFGRHAVGDGVGCVDLRAHERAGDVKTL